MGSILLLVVLSLAIFVCISNKVFSLAGQARIKRKPSRLQTTK
jgi:hypothetical protein